MGVNNMKRLIFALALVLIIEVPNAISGMMLLGGGTPVAGVATTYFGMCNAAGTLAGDDGDDSSGGAGWIVNYPSALAYSCPGTGAKTIVELGTYIKDGPTAGTPNVRVAIYSISGDDLTLICQSSTEKAVAAGYGWITWTTGSLTGTCALTGGTAYALMVTEDGDVTARYDNGTDYGTYDTDDYTGGLPANETLSGHSGANLMWAIRCGVQ